MVKYRVKDDVELRRIIHVRYPPLPSWIDEEYRRFRHKPLNELDVSEVEDMEGLFKDIKEFNEDISSWNTGNVKTMEGMFEGCEAFNQDISRWNMGNVKTIEDMFKWCKSFNQDISNWNVGNVEESAFALYGCEAFDQPIGKWNLSKTRSVECMLFGCKSFNQDLSGWGSLIGIEKDNIIDKCERFDLRNLGPIFRGGTKRDGLIEEETLDGRSKEELLALFESFGDLNDFEKETFKRMEEENLRERAAERYCRIKYF